MICAGIDAGSRTLKAILLDSADGRVIAKAAVDQGIRPDLLAESLLDELLRQAGKGRADIGRTVATGYARNQVRFADTTITEITCQARGVHHLLPRARTIIDIGGQDSKVIHLQEGGLVRDFAMNDRCAAGTGRFLEMVAQRVGLASSGDGDWAAALSELARRSTAPAAISSMCAVFAETEIVGLLSGGAPAEDILAGVQSAIASRIMAMAGQVTAPVIFTGGVARIDGMAAALEKALGQSVAVAPDPLMTGALGAALSAR